MGHGGLKHLSWCLRHSHGSKSLVMVVLGIRHGHGGLRHGSCWSWAWSLWSKSLVMESK